ncbi:glycoside hydrolase family 30 beta sandwich domain-containing protein [Bifidobacterium magnum]|uniref:glycoside hydrolase family 30 beta sandwich domain-containing protein n=1 Tax=Bifidobacterium magnum TaxID=1692 RepID=UPI0003B5296D|nr:glycoside hydrolase family 30 beta sandwich domain-containing protein [Bifidobacterium magnum]
MFHLINHYFKNGATAYVYWNMVLSEIVSTWGWQQNSLYAVDSRKGTFTRTPEWYVMRHFATYVRPGATLLKTTGHFNAMGLVFRNPDGTLAAVVQNALEKPMDFSFTDPAGEDRCFTVTLEPRSFNTFVVE